MLTEKQGKFVREVGSVVLGVLIALAIGEAADSVRWKIRVDDTMGALRSELAGNRWNLMERTAYQACVDRRIQSIGKILAEARRTGRLPPIDTVGAPSFRLVGTSAYEVSQSEGVPLHMDRVQASDLAISYEFSKMYREWTDREQQRWATLQLLEGPGGPVSPELLAAMLQAWSNAQSESFMISLMAVQGNERMAKSGIPAGEGADAWNPAEIKKASRGRGICKPMMVAKER